MLHSSLAGIIATCMVVYTSETIVAHQKRENVGQLNAKRVDRGTTKTRLPAIAVGSFISFVAGDNALFFVLQPIAQNPLPVELKADKFYWNGHVALLGNQDLGRLPKQHLIEL